MYVIVLFFALSISNAQNTCPDVQPVRNFKFDEYATGTWYEIGRYENALESGTCVKMSSTREASGYRLHVSEVDDRTLREYDGTLLNPVPERGVLDYVFPEYDVVMNVIATNYTNYALEYNCWYNATSNNIIEQGWLMSRTKELNQDIKDYLIGLLHESNVTSTDKIIWDDFSEESCSYDE